MIEVKVFCAQCGNEKTIEVHPDKIPHGVQLKAIIKEAGWIVQFNKPYFDVYCSKRCFL